jgi:prenyltransferase beta subunit
LFLTINAIPNVLGATRQSYLTSFISSNEIIGEGFTNAIEGDDTVSFEATAHALDILTYYVIFPQDIETLKTNLEDDLKEMFDNNEVVLYDLYYLLKSLNILGHIIDSLLMDRIYKFVNDTEQISGGFSFSNTSKSANLASTYYVIQINTLIDNPIENISLHKNWVLSCNNSDGGYGGNQSLTSTYLDTCFAALILDDERFGDINDLVDRTKTLAYLKSFYVNNSADLNSYGGYLPDELAEYALLSSTYYCVKVISLIESSELNTVATIAWILERQNFKDGGFAENSEAYQQKASSVIASYYAFSTLMILDPLLSVLNSEIWMVEFNYLILGIVLGSIGLVIAAAIFLLRRRRI